MIHVIYACAALLVFLLAALSFNTSRMRRKGRSIPGGSEIEFAKAVRAQGNAAEYIPLLVGLLLFLSLPPAGPSAFLAIVALIATASRILHAVGMLSAESAVAKHPLRFYGALGTYASLVLLGVALLVRAF